MKPVVNALGEKASQKKSSLRDVAFHDHKYHNIKLLIKVIR